MLAFKNNAPFRPYISKINSKFINNAENIDIVMRMYNLLECSDNYSTTSGSLCNYYWDEIKNDAMGNNADNYRLGKSKSDNYKYIFWV